MKPGASHRYWAKYKARKEHYLAGKYRKKQTDTEEE